MDLIPAAYREKLRVAGLLRRFALLCVAVVALAAAARASLEALISREGPVHARYLQLDAEGRLLNETITALRVRLENVELRDRMLSSLRGESDIAPLFAAVDRAISPAVWFQEMTFRRDGVLVLVKPEAVNTGYFIVVPKDLRAVSPVAGDQAWRTQKNLEIRGFAADHGALTSFIQALDTQPGFESVRLLQTGTRSYTTTQVVDFSLAASLAPERK